MSLFGDEYQTLVTAEGKRATKQLSSDPLTIRDVPIEYVQRERIIPRQTYKQQQTVEGKNKNIVMNDGITDRLLIGFEEDG